MEWISPEVFGSAGARQQEMTPHINASPHGSRPMPTPRPSVVSITSVGANRRASAAGAPPYQDPDQNAAYRGQDDVSDFQQMSGRTVDAPDMESRNQLQKGLTDYKPNRRSIDHGNEFCFLVIGKTGNGKSSTCNTILGRDEFLVGRGLVTTTLSAQSATASNLNAHIKVVDTADVSEMRGDRAHVLDEIQRWQTLSHNRPSAVLLAVRCDVRYKPEEHAVYRQILDLCGERSICDRLIVAFTFGDRQDRNLAEELMYVGSELQAVLKDAAGRYVVFNNQADARRKERAVSKLLSMASSLTNQARSQVPVGYERRSSYYARPPGRQIAPPYIQGSHAGCCIVS